MERVDEYLRRALEADRQAQAAISKSASAEFEKIADNWRDLARQAALLAEMESETDRRKGYPG